MRLFIEPNDVLMFRDGRPFSGGDDHFARGMCPPSPSTLYGALRSHILSSVWSEFDTFAVAEETPVSSEIGTPFKEGSLRVGQFVLAKRKGSGVELFYPLPKDISREKSEEKRTLFKLRPQVFDSSGVKTDLPESLFHLWCPSETAVEQGSGFLCAREMVQYLLGEVPDSFVEAKEIFDIEERTGILRHKETRSVVTGGLYSVEYFRFNKDMGFAVEVHGTTSLSNRGIMRLGGDHRSASFTSTVWEDLPTESLKKNISKAGRFKVVLVSPAIFAKGWLPGNIDSGTMQGGINEVKVKLAGVSLGKPLSIGGFDIARKRPKVMKRAVPAGSVYYFELKDGSVDDLFESVWLKSISDEKTNEGFGISLIGGY